MSRTGRQFRHTEDRADDSNSSSNSTRIGASKSKLGEGRPTPRPLPRQQMRQALSGLRGTNLGHYFDDVDLDD